MTEDYKKIINEIVNKIAEKFSPLKVILFGSYAYGNPTKDSDIDLLTIKESSLPRHYRTRRSKGIL